MEDNLVFGFTAGGGWLYNAPTKWSRFRLPESIQTKFENNEIKDIKCAAFGSTEDCWFVSYINKESETRFSWGPGCPEQFVAYLKDPDSGKVERNGMLKVVFGPDNSFFAWDDKSIRWHNIPAGLENCIQRWLSPAGWTQGPPRLIALGVDQAWFAMSEYGGYGYSLPGSWTELNKDWEGLKVKEIVAAQGISAISFSAVRSDQYAVVMKEGYAYCYNTPEPVERLLEVLDSLAPENIQKDRKEAREEIRRQQAREEEARQQEQKRAREREENARKAKEAAFQDELRFHYVMWKTGYEASLSNKKIFTTFPHIPVAVCKCRDVSCMLDKERENSLRACRHDVEQFLRASGSYSLEWLRKERLQWHPDKFSRHCDPDFRSILSKKATEIYAIFEVLIDAERTAA